MRRIALIYGGFAGLAVIASMIAGFTFGETLSFLTSEWVGYLIMLVAFSLIFVGIKNYRDREQGGVITFTKAFLVGLAIAGVAAIAYVITWEIYLAFTGDQFIDGYIAGLIEAERAAGVSGAALEAKIAEFNAMAEGYANPMFRVPMTFLEIFPVGLVVSLVSAAILRKSEVLPARG